MEQPHTFPFNTTSWKVYVERIRERDCRVGGEAAVHAQEETLTVYRQSHKVQSVMSGETPEAASTQLLKMPASSS